MDTINNFIVWQPIVYDNDGVEHNLGQKLFGKFVAFSSKEESEAYIALADIKEKAYSICCINNEDRFADYIERNLFWTASTHNLLQLYTHDLDLFLAVKDLFPDIPNDFLKRKLFFIKSYLEDYIDNCIRFYREDS